MIKINLAARKQSSLTASTRVGGLGSGLKMGTLPSFDLGRIRELPLRKPLLYGLLSAGLWYGWSLYQYQQLAAAAEELQRVTAETQKISAELEKTKGYEQIKKSLEQDEDFLRTKVAVINRLIQGRQDPPKILLALATGTPKEVWVDTFTNKDQSMVLHGLATSFETISDLMKGLGESAYFTDVRLVESKEVKDAGPLSGNIDFNIAARKKQ